MTLHDLVHKPFSDLPILSIVLGVLALAGMVAAVSIVAWMADGDDD